MLSASPTHHLVTFDRGSEAKGGQPSPQEQVNVKVACPVREPISREYQRSREKQEASGTKNTRETDQRCPPLYASLSPRSGYSHN